LHSNTTCTFAREVAGVAIAKANALGFNGVTGFDFRVQGVRMGCEVDDRDTGISADCTGGGKHVWFVVNR
jgi:hypothetical protein